MTPEVSYQNDVLEIGDERLELQEEIFDVLVTDDLVFVVFERGEMDPRNLVAFDFDGDQVWRTPPLRKNEGEEPGYVHFVKEADDDGVLVFTSMQRYRVDPATWDVEHLGWYK